MALQRATNLGGDFLDLRQLVKDNGGRPVLAVFRVTRFEPLEGATGFDGWNFPVIADVLVCSGPSQGSVHSGERFIGAITATLRGVRNARKDKGESPADPVNAVGAEIAVRLKLYNEGRANEAAVGDEPSDAEFAEIAAVHADGAAWAAGQAAPANGVPVGAESRPF